MSNSVRIGVIGMGNAGPGIASALRAGGAQIVGVSARSAAARDRAEAMLPGIPILSPQDVAAASEVLVLAVPDSQVAPLTRELVQSESIRPGMVVVHLAGSLGLSALQAATDIGAIPIALHPVMTFSGTSLDVLRLEGSPVAYTAPALAQPVAQALVQSLGATGFPLDDEVRALYHAGLTHAANHLFPLVAQGTQVLSVAGITEPSAVMGPLLRASLDRALQEGMGGLTGPVARGDAGTIEAHLQALRGRPQLANAAQTYASMTSATRAALAADAPGQETVVARTRDQLAEALAADPRPTSLVMTMGALHPGHLSLVEAARRPGHKVVATIFVNPEQFGPEEDFAAYPRTLDEDVAALSEVGVDIVYAPTVDQVYSHPPRVQITPGPQGQILEGALRPGHFAGVLQVVGKMFNLIRPQVAVFGQKDAQQFVNIAQMVADLDMPVELVQAPIIRDDQGLALSSRNAYLSDEQADQALALNHSLRVGAREAAAGAGPSQIVAAATEVLERARGVEVEYVALADAHTFAVAALGGTAPENVGLDGLASLSSPGRAYLLVAARVGSARLIDNMILEVQTSE